MRCRGSRSPTPRSARVGLTERQARDAGLNVRIGQSDAAKSSRGWIHKAGNQGFIKLVADVDAGVLVGGTAAGPVGGEVMSALAVAVHGRVPLTQLRHMIFAYPTFQRAISEALAVLGLTGRSAPVGAAPTPGDAGTRPGCRPVVGSSDVPCGSSFGGA